MAISIDYGNTDIITVELADLTLVSGTFYTLDSNAFRLTLKDIEDDENGIVFPDTHRHVDSDTIAGATDAKKVIILSPYSVEFPDSQITVQITGTNNNIHDVGDGKLQQNQAQIIPSNSFGLVTVSTGSGVTAQDKTDIISGVWNSLLTAHNTSGTFGWFIQKLLTVAQFLVKKQV